MLSYFSRTERLIATLLVAIVLVYIGWRAISSPEQAMQFGFNGLSVGAIYALMAIGFTLVYSTVWFFDLYYGAAAALGAYSVFYLRSQEWLGGQYQVNTPVVNIILAMVVAGVAAWVIHTAFYGRLREKVDPTVLRIVGGAVAMAIGAYTGLVLTFPSHLHVTFGPVAAVVIGIAAMWGIKYLFDRVSGGRGLQAGLVIGVFGRMGTGCLP